MRRAARGLAALAAAGILCGCETMSYYAQALSGQMELMSRARPVQAVIEDPATPQALRERLALARSIREFAVEALALPDNSSYRSYADLGRRYVVWNVVAAPEFSLKAAQSCFPVAGCVSYRGFFARDDAVNHAARLLAEGNDVHMYGVPAYSTLGRFDDPLLSTFIEYPEVELARLVFHELAHQVVYVKNDSTFNESFAVAVERAGVRRWLAAAGRERQLAGFLDAQRRKEAFQALLAESRGRLEALYRMPIPPEAMRERKRAELDALAVKLPKPGRESELPRYEPNNAMLASFATYTALVPAFEKILAEEGGDLGRFYARVKRLAAEGKSP